MFTAIQWTRSPISVGHRPAKKYIEWLAKIRQTIRGKFDPRLSECIKIELPVDRC